MIVNNNINNKISNDKSYILPQSFLSYEQLSDIIDFISTV